MPTSIRRTDVLILGSGLAGLRAAWAAKKTRPHLDVTVACLKKGPSGSSFTNRNNALGIQFLDTDDMRTSFEREAMALGWPGTVQQPLIHVLAEESQARTLELEKLGLRFRRDDNGSLTRHPGCGSQLSSAVIFDDLTHAFNQLLKKTNSYHIEIITDVETLGIAKAGNTACGAWFAACPSGEISAIRARTTILALGGPAPLYHNHMSGAANPGLSYGLMADANVQMTNTGFHQFMWGSRDKTFSNPADPLSAENRILPPDGKLIDPVSIYGKSLEILRSARLAHCPAFYSRPDSALDHLLLKHRQNDGFVHIKTPEDIMHVAPYAHAGNGGAIINEHGETSVNNLYAVGECATGMHGANRMGGAMVLATQVFGRRAGIAAALRAHESDLISEQMFKELIADAALTASDENTAEKIEQIRRAMQCHALPAGREGLTKFRNRLKELSKVGDRRLQLTALAAYEASRSIKEPTAET